MTAIYVDLDDDVDNMDDQPPKETKVSTGPETPVREANGHPIPLVACNNDQCNGWKALPQIYNFHIYTGPKFTQIPDIHWTQIYTNPDLHGTHIYTAQIYTNPFPHIDSKKPKFTQPKFTQNPNLHNPTLHITQIYTKLFLQILLKLYKVNSIINPD